MFVKIRKNSQIFDIPNINRFVYKNLSSSLLYYVKFQTISLPLVRKKILINLDKNEIRMYIHLLFDLLIWQQETHQPIFEQRYFN